MVFAGGNQINSESPTNSLQNISLTFYEWDEEPLILVNIYPFLLKTIKQLQQE